MKVVRNRDRSPKEAKMPGALGVGVTGVITEGDGSPTAAMRLFEIAPGGHTPWHAHDWEHVIYVVEGQGALKTEHGDTDVRPGDSLLVEPNEQHNFVNKGEGPWKFICVVPLRGDK